MDGSNAVSGLPGGRIATVSLVAQNIFVRTAILAHPNDAVMTDADHARDSASSVTDRRELVERLRRGDRAALEKLIADHRDAVTRLVFRLAGWSGETEDLVQEVFLAA